jgi:lipopolysaccharide/colanic/teichoic acid biosynthesis glycosyltransferase
MYKLRSMTTDAEANGHAWATVDDPRVTRVGGFLRKTRLDEMPQLWNVIKGDMSMVGPRPERPEYQDALIGAVPFWNSRLLLKPGITGWAQVSDGYASDFEGTASKLSYDLWYLRHRSLPIDALICAKTLWKLVSGGSGGR